MICQLIVSDGFCQLKLHFGTVFVIYSGSCLIDWQRQFHNGLARHMMTPYDNGEIKDASEMIGSSFEGAMMSMVQGTMTAKDAFRSMATDIISELYRIFVVKQITGFISGAIMGSFAPKLAGTGGGGGKAIGGPVQANQSYVVGERGPEMFIPSRSGSIVPNNKMGGGGVVVQQTFNFAANGDESVKQIIAQQAPKIAKMTQQSIMESRRRGGQMKAVFG